MNSKKGLLLLCISITAYGSALGQADIVLSQSDIATGTPYYIEKATTDFRISAPGSTRGKIYTFAGTSSFSAVGGTRAGIPLNQVFMKLISVGDYLVTGTAPEINLSTQSQNIYDGHLFHLRGAVSIGYRIPIANYSWPAGTYETNLRFTKTGFSNATIGDDKKLTLTIPSFMEAPGVLNPPDPVLHVNSLDYYRNIPEVSATINLGDVISTVPFNILSRATSYHYTFTGAAGGTATIPYGGNGVSFSTNAASPLPLKNIYHPMFRSHVPVPVGNRTHVELHYFISRSFLNNDFKSAGEYTLPISYSIYAPDDYYDGVTPPPQANSAGSVLKVLVDDMAELLVNDAEVNLEFNTAADYVNGTSAEMTAHLKLSKTTPYDVYVKASATDLSNGTSSIPVNIIKVGPANGQTGVQTITLSATPAKIISGAEPVIDRNLGIKYTIDPADAKTLVDKAPGVFTVNVIYSFIAN
ncbi:hypothetical protein [Parapedobacter tibetensis]|uniref:hypothetical protein n=1 Tax=Parapedobacter tibetensis TaxID=2972951 RepID=UPI00214D904B|nr:hypothetical protein [Parapedobacter tibetensis]